MSLPAGPMISLTVALEGVYELWPREGEPRRLPGIDFVTGLHANVLAPGELLRAIHLPVSALRKRHAFRRASLTHLGRSSVLLIGTCGSKDLLLTVTAATIRPVQIRFNEKPAANVSCAPRSMPRFRPSSTSTTCTVLRHIAATSPITSPRKSARSSSLHEPDRQR